MASNFVSPGIYVTEIDKSQYVSNLADTAFGVVGSSTWGPMDTPTLVTSHNQFFSTFGNTAGLNTADGVIANHPMMYAVTRYLKSGRRCYVVRVGHSNHLKKASYTLKNGNNCRVLVASGYYNGTHGNNIRLKVAAGTKTNTKKLTIGYVYSGSESPGTVDNEAYDNLIITDSTSTDDWVTKVNKGSSTIQLDRAAPLATGGTYGGSVNLTSIAGTPSTTGGSLTSATYHWAVAMTNAAGEADATTTSYKTDSDAVTGPTGSISIALGSAATNPTSSEYVSIYVGTSADNMKLHGIVQGNGNPLPAYVVTSTAPALETAEAPADIQYTAGILAGGTDGNIDPATGYLSLTDADVNGVKSSASVTNPTGIRSLENADTYNIALLAAPGCCSTGVTGTLIEVAELRGDCIALVDTPYGVSDGGNAYSAQNAVSYHNGAPSPAWVAGNTNWRMGTTGSAPSTAWDSSFAATYYPWCKVSDDFTGTKCFIPPSCFAAEKIAYSDFVSEPWFAPAGSSRGKLTNILQLAVNPTQGERDLMYSGGNAINPIVSFRGATQSGSGVLVFGQRTLQRNPTALDRINVRRLLIFLRKQIKVAARDLLFEPNDPTMWRQFEGIVRPFLQGVKNRRGLVDYKVQMDASTNTADVIENNMAVGNIFIKPTKAAEIIVLNFIVTSQSATFTETVTTQA